MSLYLLPFHIFYHLTFPGFPFILIPNIFSVIKSIILRLAGYIARMEEVRSAFKILTGTPIGKRPLWRPRRIWLDNIRMDLKEIGINMRN